MKKLLMIVALAASGPLGSAMAKDLLVDPKNPAAYPTLQAAMNAAVPGDRILVKGPLMGADVVIDKSVTIESVDHTLQDLILFDRSGPHDDRILIQALTPGKPLTLRRLHIDLVPMGNARDIGIRSSPTLSGEVRMEDIRVTLSGPNPKLTTTPCRMGELTLDGRLWMRRCELIAPDTQENFAAGNWMGRHGTDCLLVRATTLIMEDCVLRAGSAGFGKFTPSLQDPVGGDGGFALKAQTFWTVLVRSSFSDGNGGFLQPGAWKSPPKPGKAVRSQFTGPMGTLSAYASPHEVGRDGALVKTYNARRGTSGPLGAAEAPLMVGGSAVLGKSVEIEIAASSRTPAALAFGFGWSLTQFPPFGDVCLELNSWFFTVPVSGPGKLSFGVPNIAALVHLPFLSQIITTSGNSVELGNPSGIAVAR